MIEEWRDIKGYEGLYQVSNLGNVKNSKNDRLLKLHNHNSGYKNIKIRKKPFLIHRLVAETFIPNPLNLPCVNHKDGDKYNNIIDNLEWCTHSQNTRHAFNIGLMSGHPDVKARRCRCIELDLIFDSVLEAQKFIGSKSTHIYDVLNQTERKRGNSSWVGKTAGGYHWEYIK